MHRIVAFGVGLLFGIGLCVSGMSQPDKVLGFLDVTGLWDPSLAFVMGGALAVASIGFGLAARRSRTVLGDPLRLPASRAIDPSLVGGALLFGIGWGLSGLCPGPALGDLGFLDPRVAIFVLAMLAGMALHGVRPRVSQALPTVQRQTHRGLALTTPACRRRPPGCWPAEAGPLVPTGQRSFPTRRQAGSHDQARGVRRLHSVQRGSGERRKPA